ncbi:mechanosensitive ion channel protein MscS [Orrella marina]|uniref:Mechanosensitive ion channel protein MscS n=2 Tax=Orrella marina TaxID=2163011 RepID=A0A2R4XQ06_9BURK|nr:mechanosensitive ion channel protein MscS [Orrella marina]
MLIASINVIIILILALIIRGVVSRLLTTLHQRLSARAPGVEERKRIDTLSRIFGYISSIAIGVVTAMLILAELGISIAPLLATAGVVGIAISFGAQSLVKDYFMGFVMLMENQIRQGDFIEAAGKSGTVEEVTLRHVRLRDGEGAVHYLPNSAITTVTNHSRQFAYAVVDIGVAYDANLGRTYEVIKEVGQALRQDPDQKDKILDDVEILGVNQLEDSAVGLRLRMKTDASAKWGIRRELLARLKQAFDTNGIEIPFPQRVLRVQREEDIMGNDSSRQTRSGQV